MKLKCQIKIKHINNNYGNTFSQHTLVITTTLETFYISVLFIIYTCHCSSFIISLFSVKLKYCNITGADSPLVTSTR